MATRTDDAPGTAWRYSGAAYFWLQRAVEQRMGQTLELLAHRWVFEPLGMRHSRYSWRADLRALYDGWVWREPALAFHLVDRLFQPLTTLIAPIYFLIALYRLQWDIMLILLVWWMLGMFDF